MTTIVRPYKLSTSTDLPEYHLKLNFLRATDRRHYDALSGISELAGIVPSDVETFVNAREVIVRPKGGPLMRITEVQVGWNCNMQYSFLPLRRLGSVPVSRFVISSFFLRPFIQRSAKEGAAHHLGLTSHIAKLSPDGWCAPWFSSRFLSRVSQTPSRLACDERFYFL
ncbi:hypothetical protein EDB83DRAFT_1783437 [Lactarius deliciosus]|nr:hypothetical protein EDB83DRAFT_1783437 [Lactarius deliciosus]